MHSRCKGEEEEAAEGGALEGSAGKEDKRAKCKRVAWVWRRK
jgi:hypothetical protein